MREGERVAAAASWESGPTPIPLARVHALQPLVAFRRRAGLPLSRGISALLQDDTRALPLVVAGRLWTDSVRETSDPGLALRVAATASWHDIPLGRLVRPGTTLGEAVETLGLAGARFCTGQQIDLRPVGGDVWLARSFPRSLREGRREANDFALAMMIDLVRSVAGRGWRPQRLRLEGPPPRHHEELATLALREVSFGARADALPIPRELLERRVPIATAGLEPPTPVPTGDFAESAREALRALLPAGELSLGGLARAAGASERSLQRRLAESGCSYARLADEVRSDAARRLLQDLDARVTDVALELGYTDSANFTRAFRRWTGMPPLAFRRLSADASEAAAAPR